MNISMTLPTREQLFGDSKNQKILEKSNMKADITDFAILLGGKSFNGKGIYFTQTTVMTNTNEYQPVIVNTKGNLRVGGIHDRNIGSRPCLISNNKGINIAVFPFEKVKEKKGIMEGYFGRYPQTVVNIKFSNELEQAVYSSNIITTGNTFTTDSPNVYENSSYFRPRNFTEFEYNGEKYIRVVATNISKGETLSDGRVVKSGDAFWIKVEPIKWIFNRETNIAITKNILFAGVSYYNLKNFIDCYFINNIVNKNVYNYLIEKNKIENIIEEKNSIKSSINTAAQKEFEKEMNNVIVSVAEEKERLEDRKKQLEYLLANKTSNIDHKGFLK